MESGLTVCSAYTVAGLYKPSKNVISALFWNHLSLTKSLTIMIIILPGVTSPNFLQHIENCSSPSAEEKANWHATSSHSPKGASLPSCHTEDSHPPVLRCCSQPPKSLPKLFSGHGGFTHHLYGESRSSREEWLTQSLTSGKGYSIDHPSHICHQHGEGLAVESNKSWVGHCTSSKRVVMCFRPCMGCCSASLVFSSKQKLTSSLS